MNTYDEFDDKHLCPYEQCDNYLLMPICHNHAHVKCDQFKEYYGQEQFLRRFRESQGRGESEE